MMARATPVRRVDAETESGIFDIDEIYKQIGESDFNQDVSGWLSTGFLPLDYAISGSYSNGGFPQGRITEVMGPESSGKTMLATMALISTQKKGGLAVMLDYEHAFSLRRAIQLGLNTDRKNWIYKQPLTSEDGFQVTEIICNMVRKDGLERPVTICFDSIAAMMTREEFDCEVGKESMKTDLSLPKFMSRNLPKLAMWISRTNVTCLFLNQLRDNPGVLFGDKETTPGGKAMRYFASCRLRIGKGQKVLDEAKRIVGEEVTVRVTKNKVGMPHRVANYISSFEEGINLHLSHINALNELGLLGTTKGWLDVNGERWRKGDLEKHIRADTDAYQQLLKLFEEPVPAESEEATEAV